MFIIFSFYKRRPQLQNLNFFLYKFKFSFLDARNSRFIVDVRSLSIFGELSWEHGDLFLSVGIVILIKKKNFKNINLYIVIFSIFITFEFQ